jgi:hypothetical protein
VGRADTGSKTRMITATWADAVKAKHGFTYRSRCDQVVRELRFLVVVIDPAGDEARRARRPRTAGCSSRVGNWPPRVARTWAAARRSAPCGSR